MAHQQLCIVDFDRVIQNLHTIEKGDKAVMMSRVFFKLTTSDGKNTIPLFVDIGQPYGTTYSEEPLETGSPFIREADSYPKQSTNGPFLQTPFTGDWNHNDFADLAENYYRSLVGTDGNLINIGEDSSGSMSNIALVSPSRGTMTVDRDIGGPW